MTPRRANPSGPGSAWAAYTPTPEAPWDLRRVVHLHRRAGFGATWPEIRRDLEDGPEASVARVLAGTSRVGGRSSDEFESTSTLLADSAVASGDPNRLAAWWAFRMLESPDPLGERLTLMWHDHFPSGRSKVEDLALMRRQNDTLRRLARGPFGDLLNSVVRDPALLVYLDAPGNRKGHPNENLGRELLELFTLGIGRYTEADVRDAARALTGWTVVDGAFEESPKKHDDGEKTILGRRGVWGGADLLAILLDQPATARRVARRLCGLLMGEGTWDEASVDLLADDLRTNRLDVGHSVGTILRSRAFFEGGNIGSRVVGPVEFVVGACRTLVPSGTMPSTLIVADWMARLGQELFEPPNVGGWPGGRAWLTARSLAARANFAASLVEGRPVGLAGPLDARSIDDPSSLLGLPGPSIEKDQTPEAARRALATMLASPEAQLG